MKTNLTNIKIMQAYLIWTMAIIAMMMILRQPLTINCPAKVLLGLTVKEDPRILLLMGALSGTCSARIVVWSFMMDPVLQQQPLPVSVWLEGHCAPPRAAPNSTAGIAKQVSCLPEAQLETS